MNKNKVSSLLPLCRLCGILGHHAIDIFDEISRPGASNANALRDDIFYCVKVRAERDDETTKVCGYCFSQIHNFVAFREMCSATNRKMQKSKSRRIETSGDVINEPIRMREADIERVNSSCRTVSRGSISFNKPSNNYISLSDDDAESENDREDAFREIGIDGVPSLEYRNVAATKSIPAVADTDSGDIETQTRMNRSPQFIVNESRKHSTASSDGDEWEVSIRETPFKNQKTASSKCEQDLIMGMVQQSVGITHATDEFSKDIVDSPVAWALSIERDAGSNSEKIDAWTENVKERNRSIPLKPHKSAKNKAAKNVSTVLIECRTPAGSRCKESFESWDAMMHHVTSYHAKGVKKIFCCHLCKKTSKYKQALQRHMNSVHNREIRFKCPIRRCAKIFTQKYSLKKHTNAVHTKRVAFKCTKCPMRFYRKDQLTRHLANRHGLGMTFSCYLCKKASYGKQNLQLHINSLHAGHARFKCPFPMCSKSFSQKGDLNRHTNAIHTKKNVFKCTECDKEFCYKQSLNRHIAMKH